MVFGKYQTSPLLREGFSLAGVGIRAPGIIRTRELIDNEVLVKKIILPSTKSVRGRTLELLSSASIILEHQKTETDIPILGLSWEATASFAHQSRIPKLVESGAFDVGVVGYDSILESGADVQICADLLFNRSTNKKARVVLVASEKDECDVNSISEGTEILTEYPNLAKAYFENIGKSMILIPSRGSIEAEIPSLYRFGICLTETGSSLRAQKLKVIGTLCETSTVLIANKNCMEATDFDARMKFKNRVRTFKTLLLGAINGQDKVLVMANVSDQILSSARSVLPALSSPTVSPLAQKGYSAISAVVPKALLNTIQEQLLSVEATGIVVVSLISVIPKREEN